MARAYELINIMNNTDRNQVVTECKRELRKVLKEYGYRFIYDTYCGWQITC